MGRILAVVLVWGLLVFAPFVCAQAAVYVYVDAEGTAHFTDAPTKTYFRPLPAFGLPPGINLTSGQYADLINAIATQNGVDPALVKAIIRAESGFDQRAVSRKGAQGLMQLMPETADRYAVGDAFDPADNIRGGVRYLKFLQDLFPGQLHLAVAAYNAGENAVLRYGGLPPYAETREYVTRVFRFYGQPDAVATAAPIPAARPTQPQRTARAARPQPVPSTPSVYRQVGPDGTPHYTNLPPLVRSPQAPMR
ncbi:MAG: transglycosylase SLT domain-containing protein [candidate division NC10 bacterium]